MNSNIVAGSNVFISRTDNPHHDPDFLAEVQDFQLLRYIAKRKVVDRQIPKFTHAQEDILRTEMRCTYAKNDPCWGYSESRKKVVSACINGECPKIRDCNPYYSAEEARYWITTLSERRQYGRPDRLRRYYRVDMISEEEMSRYDINLRNAGNGYPIPKSQVLTGIQYKKENSEKARIDPVSGRKMVVIGYRWVITDNASYENEELLPIWGFVEDADEIIEDTVVRRKAKRIEKKQASVQKKKKAVKRAENNRDPDFERKEEFEKAVAASIADEIKLTNVDPDVINADDEMVILLDNPAELAFVSATFLVSGISHGLKTDMPIRMAVIDDYLNFTDRSYVMISNTVLKAGCRETNVQAWKALAKRHEIDLLHVAEREFFKFRYGDQNSRWTCRNMYGVTHVCVDQTDIINIEKLSDGVYPVSLADNGNTYMILEKNGELLGHLGKSFVDLINSLKDAGEISGLPAMINGISLQIQGSKAEFLGMGHLKFIEY